MNLYLFSRQFIKHSFFILLSFSVLHPDVVFANIAWNDTAYYFNERGQLLWCDVHAAQPNSYVIKTKKTNNEIFQDIPLNDASVQLSADYDTALVSNISRSTARRVAWLIRHGKINDPLVLENIVPILDKRIMRRMYDNIISRCTSGNAHQEHGGVVYPDGRVTCITGELSDAEEMEGASLYLKQKALVYYHSHPDACIEQRTADRGDAHNPNRVQFSQTSEVKTISYVQGPSRQDQESVGEGTGYVFGIKTSGGLIYIYDKDGIKATLPVAFVKRSYKPSGKQIKKKRIDTYVAGL
ncbi:hypothetical protein A4H97_12775 [Niastella yeongjuensis]|uniref:Uncharacterized protein n=1 Tax=Niastella yeongjuensis TaxID=354355 RepID=A0A1V9EAK0_9BACT|nr:hypothetical protein [Niastella yeongjuensis]OQP43014.1 hypothetical protein A4H97_12775 [Niastella yeongjuensis]SEO63265.1 hypothetical protein SAMN05660816_03224 [Niastella yeongjuensis]